MEPRAEFTEPLRRFELAAYTRDGATLVTAECGKQVDLWDAQTGKHRRGFEVEGPPRHVNIFGLAVSADGKHAAFKLLEAIIVVELDTGKTVWRVPWKSDRDEPVALSRDGLLAFAGRQGVRIWDWRANKLVAELPEGGELIRRVCFSPDGKRLAWSGSDGNIRVWDVEARKEALPQIGHRGEISVFALRADGKQFATVDYARTLRI